jgi:hypothetical protein
VEERVLSDEDEGLADAFLDEAGEGGVEHRRVILLNGSAAHQRG